VPPRVDRGGVAPLRAVDPGSGTPPTAGRPRDATIDERALAATRELLAEVGFEGTTVQAVAHRSGVHASAIYRRWPARVNLIEAALSPVRQVTVAPTGDLRRDLRRFLRAYVAMLTGPAVSAAASGLFTHYATTGTSSTTDFVAVSARPQLVAILRAAPPGAVDPSLDIDDVFDVLLGAVLARALVPTVAARKRSVDKLVDLAVRMVRPA